MEYALVLAYMTTVIQLVHSQCGESRTATVPNWLAIARSMHEGSVSCSLKTIDPS